MTQYMLSVYPTAEQQNLTPGQIDQLYKEVDTFNAEVRAAGAWVFGGGLHPPATATVVRVQGADVITTDGPFAETKEQLGGFWILRAPDLDAALAWASKATRACGAPVEVRPFEDDVDD